MRIFLLTLLTLILGIALGLGAAVVRIQTSPWDPQRDESVAAEEPAPLPPGTPVPKIVVPETSFDFGALDLSANGSHDFVIKNEGTAPLKLTEGGTSCRCTMSKLDKESIPPGGSAKVTITWKPIDRPGPYQQTAKILTNDPAQSQIILTISGRITAAVRFSPTELVFSRLSAGEATSDQAHLFCYLDKPPKILGQKWEDASTASFYEAALEPLPADEVAKEPTAKSGWIVQVKVKPGLPQGPIQQKLILQTDMKSNPSLALPIQGNIGSEIAVVGPRWDPEKGVLWLGEVSGREGIERRLLLVVRGPLRKEVKFKVASVSPAVLRVSLGKPSEINSGTVIQVPLLLDIPPGSRAANHLGSEQGALGEINLETTHPQVPKLRIFVRFAIEG